MNLEIEAQQREYFKKILFDLSKNQDELKDSKYKNKIYKRFESLYYAEPPQKPFRHFYTDIFSVLTQIQQNPTLGDINILGQNLDIIRKNYISENQKTNNEKFSVVSEAIKKLYDHVNLDIARISYSDGADRKVSGESYLEEIQGQIESLKAELTKANNTEQKIQENISKTENKINSIENKLNNSQKEYITILGIFASIVLAFTTGISFSTSVLNNIAQASIYRITLISLIIGLVLINILFCLFYYINAIVNKKQKLLPIVISNSVIIFFIFITIVAWNIAFVENRNEKIQNSKNAVTNTIDNSQDNSISAASDKSSKMMQ